MKEKNSSAWKELTASMFEKPCAVSKSLRVDISSRVRIPVSLCLNPRPGESGLFSAVYLAKLATEPLRVPLLSLNGQMRVGADDGAVLRNFACQSVESSGKIILEVIGEA